MKFDIKTGDTTGGDTEFSCKWLLRNSSKEHIFIDVGAHIGAFAVPFIKDRNPFFSIIIEPDEYSCSFLRENLKSIEHQNYVIIQKVILDKSGKVKFYKFQKTCHNSIINRGYENEEIEMEVTTLDEILEQYAPGDRPIDIKIDVEAAESFVLAGMKNNLHRIHNMVLEFLPQHYKENLQYIQIPSPEDFARELEEKFEIYDCNRNNRISGGDVMRPSSSNICLKKKHD